jgi:putative addiction module component (TIGR02574 family)
MSRETILEEALRLPEEDRMAIAESLYASVSAEIRALELTPEQRKDLNMRLEEDRAGRSNTQPWEVVRERLLKGE